jgi:phosphoglucosamine mutase
MALIAESWHQDGRLAAAASSPPSCPISASSASRRHGPELHRTKVGDRYVVEHMRAHGFNVGGEQSGHIVLSDFSTTGDGLVSALQVLACIKRSNKPVSEVCRKFEPVPQVLKNVRFSGGKPLEKRRSSGDRGRALVIRRPPRRPEAGRLVIRPSGTEPLIRVMAEGDDHLLRDRSRIPGLAASASATRSTDTCAPT